jgi:hypothetical protein
MTAQSASNCLGVISNVRQLTCVESGWRSRRVVTAREQLRSQALVETGFPNVPGRPAFPNPRGRAVIPILIVRRHISSRGFALTPDGPCSP